MVLVFLTRLPVARPSPMESDEFGFLEQIRAHWFPMHHTLFLTAARLLGMLEGDEYRGILVLDMTMSALALVSLWWWLRAFVTPRAAAAGALVMAAAPVFWGYGAIAGNYTAILVVGAFLLGVACRTWTNPQSWHPVAAAVVLALGTGYRQDIGTFWLPIFLVILWKHRWRHALLAGLLFTALNLAWLLAMLHEAGGWSRYRAQTADFAYHAGYLNSIWNLGVVDAPLALCRQAGHGSALDSRPVSAVRSTRDQAALVAGERRFSHSDPDPERDSRLSRRTCWSTSACQATCFITFRRCWHCAWWELAQPTGKRLARK